MENSLNKLGFNRAKSITKRYAKSFYFSSLFLNRNMRKASYAIYALCRLSDESVDSVSPDAQLNSLTQIKENIDTAYSGKTINNALLAVFSETVRKYNIPKLYFDELIDGMHMDIYKNRYRDFDELSTYCFRVAGVIGLIMLKIFRYKDVLAEKYASELGIAMQLTNILRDIKEDASRGRIYIPLDEIEKFKVRENNILSGEFSENIKSLIKFQIERARNYYKNAEKGLPYISSIRAKFVIILMKDVYSEILNEIEKLNYNVFIKRAAVSKFKKLIIMLKVILFGRYL